MLGTGQIPDREGHCHKCKDSVLRPESNLQQLGFRQEVKLVEYSKVSCCKARGERVQA